MISIINSMLFTQNKEEIIEETREKKLESEEEKQLMELKEELQRYMIEDITAFRIVSNLTIHSYSFNIYTAPLIL